MGLEGECTELLQALVRNGCVNDGTVESGQEQLSADLLATYLEGPGLDLERHTAAPGRTSLVARIEGRDPDAPTLLLMGHTDVVPANGSRRRHDPFGGELVDGEVWRIPTCLASSPSTPRKKCPGRPPPGVVCLEPPSGTLTNAVTDNARHADPRAPRHTAAACRHLDGGLARRAAPGR